jgi:hypothetical protein
MRRVPKPIVAISLAVGLALGLIACFQAFQATDHQAAATERPVVVVSHPAGPAEIEEASGEQVRGFCATCHLFPPPESLPRHVWKDAVQQGFDFAFEAGMRLGAAPSRPSVEAYYLKRAPAELSLPRPGGRTDAAIPFERRDYSLPDAGLPAVCNVRFAHLSDERRLDLLACDMLQGRILRLRPYETSPQLEVLCDGLESPAHVEVVDLDGDGVKDLLVANLGDFLPTNRKCGSVVWLRGSKSGGFTPIPLLENVGRVADVQAADLNGDGKLDLAVAVFGWRQTGEVLYLENRTLKYDQPLFASRLLDSRHGPIHVPIGDINGDGKLDIVALISQQHETVVAYLNDGGGRFTPEILFTAPHPAYGSSGIELVDLNQDGRLDVLYTNGDTLDSAILWPHHGVRWLENRGVFPFSEHSLTALAGAYRALARDLDGDGRLDILAVSLLTRSDYGKARRNLGLNSIIVLRHNAPGQFERYALESVHCDYATCDIGDFDGDGRLDFATGSLIKYERNESPGPSGPTVPSGSAPWVSIWRGKSVREPDAR